jgi:hypothetical protein
MGLPLFLLVAASTAQLEGDPQYAMHEAWCALPGHEQQVPCMKHRAIVEIERQAVENRRRRLEQIDEQNDPEVGEKQIREMHDWFCGRKNAREAAVDGSVLHDFCMGWADHRERHAMHEAWCALPDHAPEQLAPCLKHHAMQEVGPQQDDEEARNAILEQIDQSVGPSVAEAQFRQMADWWCGRKEALGAPAGSTLRYFCDGWADHKLQEGIKDEM